MRKYNVFEKNESGFASLVIALILILVLALLTVGFAQLARREQQNALNKELSNQAYYAAETGINDIYKAIYSSPATIDSTTTGVNQGKCLPSLPFSSTIDASTETSITCAIVTLNPSSLKWTIPNGSDTSLTFTNDQPLSTITINWDSNDYHNQYYTSASTTKFPSQSQWGTHAPVLEFSVTPLGYGTGLSRQNMIQNTYTAYLYPSTANDCPAPPPPVGVTPVSGCTYTASTDTASSQAPVLNGDCNSTNANATTYSCSVTLTGLPTADPTPTNPKAYLVHIVSLYDDSTVEVEGHTAGGSSGSFTGEAVIDVTGKAKNVLKRVQEVVTNAANLPSGAIEAQNVCKRLQTAPTMWNNLSGTTFIAPNGNNATPTNYPDCYLN